jgi:hypothetical protein
MIRALTICACLLACACAAAQAPPIGRLFFTPAERQQLDQQRGGVPAPAVAEAPAAAAPPPAPPEPVTLNGIVRRSSGKTTAWLNQVPQDDGQNRVSGPPSKPALTLQLPSGREVLLKPGQRVEQSAGTVSDVDAR